MAAKKKKSAEVVGFLGVGLDAPDEHKRITRTDHFLLVGGSKDTHEQMQDVTIRFNESLGQRGKELREVSLEEVAELMQRAMEG